MRFLGNIEAKTDVKGRAFLPAIFRKVLQAQGEEVLVLRRDVFQKCLVLYPESVWNERLDMLKNQLRTWKPVHQQMFRQFVSEAEVVSLDGNGRFLISKRLLKAAEIDQDIQFIGMDDQCTLRDLKSYALRRASERLRRNLDICHLSRIEVSRIRSGRLPRCGKRHCIHSRLCRRR